ncbi:MAG TPA: UMP kinase [Armatimonadota bacterium]|nr:UMP kinase [Armatimonadota bacterium]
MTPKQPKWKRVLLKLSGQAFAGDKGFGVDTEAVKRLASEIKDVHKSGVEIAVIVGGGNYIRGSEAARAGIERASADYMGMLATVINALALQDALEKLDVVTRVQTAVEMAALAEPFIRRRAMRHLEKDRVVILAAGTGNPFFTTDTAAVLRALEIHAEIVLKATNVDGVYDRDPKTCPDAKKLDRVDYMDAIKQGLGIMDLTAFTMCKDYNLPMVVFDAMEPGAIKRAALGEPIGTYIGRDKSDL